MPEAYIGAVLKLCEERRGTYKKTEYIGATRVILATAKAALHHEADVFLTQRHGPGPGAAALDNFW